MGSKLYFTAYDATNGYELRWIDTTQTSPAVNTIDIAIGTASSSAGRYGGFTAVSSKLYFTAFDAANGDELRWIDTTQTSPTVNKIDIASGAGSSSAGQYGGFTAVGSKLYFTAYDATHGDELRWIDTTQTSPTVNTVNIASGADSSYAGQLGGFMAVGSKLYFTAHDATNGSELRWIDTAQTSPTVNTINIASGAGSSYAGQYGGLTALDSKLYFTAYDATNGYELRWIDTTQASLTVNTINIASGPSSSSAGQFGGFAAVGSKLYFTAYDPTIGRELRWIDTTQTSPAVNTINIASGTNHSFAGQYGGFMGLGSKLYFTAYDPTNGSELRWIDTAQTSPTVNTIDIASGGGGSSAGQYGGFTAVGSKLYFTAYDGTNGYDLRWIDTTQASPTVNTINIASGGGSSYAGQYGGFTAVGSKLYFTAYDSTNGQELRWIDTTQTSPTVNTINIATGANHSFAGQYGGFITIGDKLYFTAYDATNGYELRWIDTTQASPTVNTVDIGGAASSFAGQFGGFTAVGSKLYFTADDDNGSELRWIDTAQASSTVNTIDIASGAGSSLAGGYGGFTVVGSKLYFTAYDATNGYDLRWIDTAQTSLTVNTINIASGADHSYAGYFGGFTAVGSKLFFNAYDATSGQELRWVDTMQASPTVNTIDIATGANSSITGEYGGFMVVGSKLYFTAYDVAHGHELRWIDTTQASPTVNTIDIASGAGSSSAGQFGGFAAVGSKLYFSASKAGFGIELFSTASNKTPTDIALSNIAVDENVQAPSVVGTLNTTDADVVDTFTYSFVDSLAYPDNNAFSITAGTLMLNTSANFEVQQVYGIKVRSTDSAGNFIDKVFSIQVNDVNDLATITGVNAGQLNEDAANVSGTLNVQDEDSGEDQFSPQTGVVGVYGTFEIAANGVWSYLLNNAAVQSMNHGEVLSESFHVISFDASGNSFVTITIDGVNDHPVAENDNTSTTENATVTQDVLANDTDVDTTDVPTTFVITAATIISTIGLTASESPAGSVAIVNNQLVFDPEGDFDELDAGDTAVVTIAYTMKDAQDATAIATLTINVTGVNDAPVMDAAPSVTLTSIAEDAAAITGDLVSALLGGASDVDTGVVSGIAIVGVTGIENGTWQYSVTGGATWSALGDVSNSQAKLLPSLARVRFQPNSNFNGAAELIYHAWDQTQGSSEGTFDLSAVGLSGGTTAFSTDMETATLTIISVNDAPVMTAAVATFKSITEDAFNNVGRVIGYFAGIQNVVDVDADSLPGIAITNLSDLTSGVWQLSNNGGTTWTSIGPVSPTAALLVGADNAPSKIRFVPNVNFNGSVSMTYYAWDRTTGAVGGTVDLTLAGATGGTTAFSTTSKTAVQVITPVNDAPTLNNAPEIALTTIAEDSADPAGNVVGEWLAGNMSDVDASPQQGLAIIGSTDTTGGTWQYSLDGTTWQALGTVSAAAARLLSPSASVRFVPNANFHGTARLLYRAWDQTSGSAGSIANITTIGGKTAFSAAVETATITVTPVNDAPVMSATPTPAFTSIKEDTTSHLGVPVQSFANAGVSDADAGALRGIAVTNLTNVENGTWQYSLDTGATWITMGAISPTSALLLAQNGQVARIRFLPNANFTGSVSMSYKAWDQTSGTVGGFVDASVSGGTTAFSSRSKVATLMIQAVNDAPVLNTVPVVSLPTIAEDTSNPSGVQVASLLGSNVSEVDANPLSGIAVVGATGINSGNWQYRLASDASWMDFGTFGASIARLLPANAEVRFVPKSNFNGTATLSYRAWDQTSGVSGGIANIASLALVGGTKAYTGNRDDCGITCQRCTSIECNADRFVSRHHRRLYDAYRRSCVDICEQRRRRYRCGGVTRDCRYSAVEYIQWYLAIFTRRRSDLDSDGRGFTHIGFAAGWKRTRFPYSLCSQCRLQWFSFDDISSLGSNQWHQWCNCGCNH